jgi:hypothetical protein
MLVWVFSKTQPMLSVGALTGQSRIQILKDFFVEDAALLPHIHNPSQFALDIDRSTFVCH